MDRPTTSPINSVRRWDWPLFMGWVAVGAVGSLVYSAAGFAYYRDNPDSSTFHSAFLLVALLVPGPVVGGGQWALLRGRLHLPVASLAMWAVGSAIAGWAVLGLLNFQDYEYIPSHSFLWGGVLGAFAGVTQASVLWGRVRWATAWVGVTASATALSWPAAQYVGQLVVPTNHDANLAYLVSALVTGLFLACAMWRSRPVSRPELRQQGDGWARL